MKLIHRLAQYIDWRVMSEDWLKSRESEIQRVEFHGARMQWPVDKLQNEQQVTSK